MNKIDYNSLVKEYKFGSKLDYTLDNGLHVVIIPKRGFSKYVCSLNVNYGSLTTEFIDRSTKEWVKVPNGVAHYLEHKMSEIVDENNEFKDVTEIFSMMGIEANAYTDFNSTNYYIKGSDLFYEGLNLLLDNVFKPSFTIESVEKEKGIILQEAKSYSDDPREKMSIKMYENVYKEIPYFIDVVGKDEDIKSITLEDLYKSYNTFYHPSNMTLYIIGDIDINKTMDIILDNKHYEYFEKFDKDFKIEYVKFNEIKNVLKEYDEIKLDIDIPKLRLMLKMQNEVLDKEFFSDIFKADTVLKIYFELLIGSLSDNYQEMLDKELIASGYSTNIRCEKESSSLSIGANSYQPMELMNYLLEILINNEYFEVKEEYFTAVKRNLLGSLIYIFNDIEGLIFTEIDVNLKASDLFEALDMIDSITIEDVYKVKKFIRRENISVLIGLREDNK